MAARIGEETCSICLCDYKQAKVLDCLHSFCKRCLDDHIERTCHGGHFLCPLCRCDITLPEGGVNSFVSKTFREVPRCDGCDEAPKFKCEDCDQYLCRPCRRTHDSLRVCKNHVVVGYENVGLKVEAKYVPDKRDLCSCHRKKIVKFLCSDCSEVICSKCSTKVHKGHKQLDLQDEGVCLEIRNEVCKLGDYLDRHGNELEIFVEGLKKKDTEVTDFVKTVCDEIAARVALVRVEISRIGENMKKEIKRICVPKEESDDGKSLKNLIAETENVLGELKISTKKSFFVLEETSVVQLMEMLKQLRQEVELSNSRNMVIPDVPLMSFEAGALDVDILKKQVGKLVIVRQGIINVSFDIDEIRERCCYSNEITCEGLTWCVAICRGALGSYDDMSYSDIVMIRLMLTKTSKAKVRTCEADYNVKLVNVNDENQSKIEHDVKTFTPGCSYPWLEFIHWRKLSDKSSGFVDDNNQVKIIVEMKINKTNQH